MLLERTIPISRFGATSRPASSCTCPALLIGHGPLIRGILSTSCRPCMTWTSLRMASIGPLYVGCGLPCAWPNSSSCLALAMVQSSAVSNPPQCIYSVCHKPPAKGRHQASCVQSHGTSISQPEDLTAGYGYPQRGAESYQSIARARDHALQQASLADVTAQAAL